MKKLFLILFFSLFVMTKGFAASCCAGAGSTAQIITNTNKYELRLSTSFAKVVAEKYQDDKVQFWQGRRRQHNYLLSPSFGIRLGSRHQVGGKLEFLSKDYRFDFSGEEKSKRLGDTKIVYAYELVKESPSFTWTPQIFLSLEWSLPTGRGLYESQKNGLTDVSGSGHHESKLGINFIKKKRGMRLFSNLSYAHVFKTSFGLQDIDVDHHAKLVGEIGISSWHPRRDFNYGLSLRHFKQTTKDIRMKNEWRKIPHESYSEVSPFISYALTNQSVLTLTYTDQTLIGPVNSTTLTRSLSLQYLFFHTI